MGFAFYAAVTACGTHSDCERVINLPIMARRSRKTTRGRFRKGQTEPGLEERSSMHLIWKRPDGFHGAAPTDFLVVELGGHSRLWLHRTDKDQYPFRIAGGWEENEGTVRLNNLVNLLPQGDSDWLSYLNRSYDHSMKDDRKDFFDELRRWLEELPQHVKGDTWETEILHQALRLTADRLTSLRQSFVSQRTS